MSLTADMKRKMGFFLRLAEQEDRTTIIQTAMVPWHVRPGLLGRSGYHEQGVILVVMGLTEGIGQRGLFTTGTG